MESVRSTIARIGAMVKSKEGLLVIFGLFVLFSLIIKFLKPRWLIRKIGAVRVVRRRSRTRTGRRWYSRRPFRRRRR